MGGGSDTPHPPPFGPPLLLSGWANFPPGLRPIKIFFLAPSAQVSLGQKICSAPSAPLTTQGLPPQPPLKENSGAHCSMGVLPPRPKQVCTSLFRLYTVCPLCCSPISSSASGCAGVHDHKGLQVRPVSQSPCVCALPQGSQWQPRRSCAGPQKCVRRPTAGRKGASGTCGALPVAGLCVRTVPFC